MTPDVASILAPVTLEGRWVRLEPLSTSHIPAIAAASAESRDTYAFTWVPDGLAGARAMTTDLLAEQKLGTVLPFATIRRADNRLVGQTRFMNIERWPWPAGNPNMRPVDAVEIGGTWLAASAQRTPINTEAKYLQLRHAFETWRVHRLVLITDARNARSRAAIERIGGRLEAIHRNHRVAADGTLRSSALFVILEEDWPRVRAALEHRLDQA